MTDIAKYLAELEAKTHSEDYKDSVNAFLRLGIIYEKGYKGVAKDFAKAMDYYRQAGEMESGRAAKLLALHLWHGDICPVDKAESLHWWALAEKEDISPGRLSGRFLKIRAQSAGGTGLQR